MSRGGRLGAGPYGNKALANDNLEIADRTLGLAAALSDAPAIDESLKKLRQQQSQVNAKARAEREKRRQRSEAARQSKNRLINEQLKKYRTAFVQKDFISARKHLKALQKADPGNPKWKELTTVLEQATTDEVERLFDSGVSAYSRGHLNKRQHSGARSLRSILNTNRPRRTWSVPSGYWTS